VDFGLVTCMLGFSRTLSFSRFSRFCSLLPFFFLFKGQLLVSVFGALLSSSCVVSHITLIVTCEQIFKINRSTFFIFGCWLLRENFSVCPKIMPDSAAAPSPWLVYACDWFISTICSDYQLLLSGVPVPVFQTIDCVVSILVVLNRGSLQNLKQL